MEGVRMRGVGVVVLVVVMAGMMVEKSEGNWWGKIGKCRLTGCYPKCLLVCLPLRRWLCPFFCLAKCGYKCPESVLAQNPAFMCQLGCAATHCDTNSALQLAPPGEKDVENCVSSCGPRCSSYPSL